MFLFASYWNSKFQQCGSFCVINEDRVEKSKGFGTHHKCINFIFTSSQMLTARHVLNPWRDGDFSYIVGRELEHKDSYLGVLKRGDVQMTSVGTGISHSEYNRNNKEQVHFLQIWV
ncbi:hypothetical protein FRB95_012652 [Tulasnella sp. JGI-2019a]|nr:hypothetical protein FRB95_012652 [Tulasnella sp. JGI-2019a]